MRLAIWLLAIQFVGILAPAVVLPGRPFGGPGGAPTLEGQYVLKDVILVAAGLVIAAASFRGGRMVRGDQKLRLALAGTSDHALVTELCERNRLSEADFYAWRETSLTGAAAALEREADAR